MRKLIIAAVGAALLAGMAPAAEAQGYHHERYGRWDDGWGHRPPPPPRHYRRHADWYRHVHACQARYPRYEAGRDGYAYRNSYRRCRL